jgi:peptidoglycan/xylan/chitin deacetylase (PgdA/CDA1 family)
MKGKGGIFLDKDYSVVNRVFILLNILLVGILLGVVEERAIQIGLPPIEEKGELPGEIFYEIKDDFTIILITVNSLEGVILSPPFIYGAPPPNSPLEKPKPRPPIAPVIYSGSNSGKKVAITFDDGPNGATLPLLLDILDEYGVKATFFLIGQRARGREDLVEEIFTKGHQIANHSYSHPHFSKLSKDKVIQEITKTEKILDPFMSHPYFRPPYGDYNRQTLELAHKLGYRVILWDVDTRDWMAENTGEIIARVKEKTKPGSIILFHEGKELTLKGLPEILEWLIEEGYTFVTVAELLGE